MDLTFFVAGTALFDSLATSQQILILILLFSTVRPVATSGAFLAGISTAYLICGLVGLALIDQLNALVRLFVPDLSRVTDPTYYQLQLLVGLVFIGGAVAWGLYREWKPASKMKQGWMILAQRVGPVTAFLFGAIVSATSFPFALPYVAVIEKLAAASLDPVAQTGYIVFYNLVYALPLLLPFGLFVVLREAVVPTLHLHADRVTRRLTVALMVVMGGLWVADSLVFQLSGHPWIAQRMF